MKNLKINFEVIYWVSLIYYIYEIFVTVVMGPITNSCFNKIRLVQVFN